MRGFSRANLLHMRSFAKNWPEESIVQQVVGQLPWGTNLLLCALRDIVKPIAVATWTSRILDTMPAKLRDALSDSDEGGR